MEASWGKETGGDPLSYLYEGQERLLCAKRKALRIKGFWVILVGTQREFIDFFHSQQNHHTVLLSRPESTDKGIYLHHTEVRYQMNHKGLLSSNHLKEVSSTDKPGDCYEMKG